MPLIRHSRNGFTINLAALFTHMSILQRSPRSYLRPVEYEGVTSIALSDNYTPASFTDGAGRLFCLGRRGLISEGYVCAGAGECGRSCRANTLRSTGDDCPLAGQIV